MFNSSTYERLWQYVHTDVRCLLLCNWYCIDFVSHDQFENLKSEYDKLLHVAFSVFIVIHHKKWLRFSNTNSIIDEELYSTCKELSLIQHVKGPTRNEHLLALVLSDTHVIKCKVVSAIADHCATMSIIPATVKLYHDVQRVG